MNSLQIRTFIDAATTNLSAACAQELQHARSRHAADLRALREGIVAQEDRRALIDLIDLMLATLTPTEE